MMNISREELKSIIEDYEYTPDIFTEDERAQSIKWALTQLPDGDRIIFLLYTDLQSSRKVGKILGVSHNTILKEIHKIRQKILEICRY